MESTMTLDVCHVLCDLWRIAAAPAIFYATTFATNFYPVLCRDVVTRVSVSVVSTLTPGFGRVGVGVDT